MSKFASGQFWIDTADRVVVSFVQGVVATAFVNGAISGGITEIDWALAFGMGGSYAALSLGTAIIFRGNGGNSNGKHEA